jgi:predicted  nucleic acid-binding Zn-ribbon protein
MFNTVRRELRETCAEIRDELDDHREAINEGIRDNAEVRDVLGEMDERIEKLASRVDELFLLMGAEQTLSRQEAALQAFLHQPRTMREVAAFLDEGLPRAERMVRSLFLKGIEVVPVGNGSFITTNVAIQKNTHLDEYF